MPSHICPFLYTVANQPTCQVVADLLDRPVADCVTSAAACEHCIRCDTPPQRPNYVTASLAISTVHQLKNDAYLQETIRRLRPFIGQYGPPPAPVTTCVLRGPETRTVACKPCQADSLVPVMMPVYRCPWHSECTLHNTGTFPKIQACATCGDRLEKYVELDVRQAPPAVLAAISQRAKP